jgi:uncharacterized tellurite resistance protein B-like protein
MSILRWLGIAPAREERDTDAVHRIVRELESMDPARARWLALFAFLLARVADVDLAVSEAETSEMERVVERIGGVPASQAALAVQIAKAENRLLGSTQNFLAAREFRDLASPEEKTDLLYCLFAVAAADDSISVPEEETVRQIAKELLVSNDEYLAIRSTWRDKRAVLRASPA